MNIVLTVEELHRLAEIPRPNLRLRPGDLRRECIRRHRRNRPHMRVVRRGSGSALPPGQFARFPAHPDPARPGYGGTVRQRGQNQRFDLRRRGRLPAARAAVLNRLAVIVQAVGSLEKVSRIVAVNGFVNAGPDFYDHPKVLNGASDLLVEAFGEIGRHSRTAVGVSALPLNVAVEISMVVEVCG